MFSAISALFAFLALSSACGKKGPPLPPLVRVPAAPADFAASRRGSTVDIRFVVPTTNTDGSNPADVVRVDVYALSSAEDAPSSSDAEIVRRGERVGSLTVNPPPDPDEDPDQPKSGSDSNSKPQNGVDQGATAHVNDELRPSVDAGVRSYVGVAVNRRGRRGPASTRMAVPLGPAPAAPAPPTVTYTETEIAVAWTPQTTDGLVHVYATRGAGTRLTDRPLATGSFVDKRIDWGDERCYAVSTLHTVNDLTLESAESTPTCVTLADTFPPAAPAGLAGVAAEGSINLIWNANSEPDLAGYLVLRATAAAQPLTPLTPAPIPETTFLDTVPAGTRVSYAIQAVDKAGNVSAMSERFEETARE